MVKQIVCERTVDADVDERFMTMNDGSVVKPGGGIVITVIADAVAVDEQRKDKSNGQMEKNIVDVVDATSARNIGKNSFQGQSGAERVGKAVESHAGDFSEASHLGALMEASSLGDFSCHVDDSMEYLVK